MIQNAIRNEVFGLSRTKVILDRSGDFCMLLLCWLDNLIKLVLYCLIYQTMDIKFDDRWRCNFWLTPIVKTKKKKVYVRCGEISAKKTNSGHLCASWHACRKKSLQKWEMWSAKSVAFGYVKIFKQYWATAINQYVYSLAQFLQQ